MRHINDEPVATILVVKFTAYRMGFVLYYFNLDTSFSCATRSMLEQEEALSVAEEFSSRVKEIEEGPRMPEKDVDYMAAKVRRAMS